MSITLYSEPSLNNPVMLCGWPGIGNVGITAIDALRDQLQAEPFGHVEPYKFFNPQKVVIEKGIITDLEFPSSRFYFVNRREGDLIFFLGQQQPTDRQGSYAEGHRAYNMAQLVLNVAEKFGCRRVYTSGAAVTRIHHSARPRVWAVPNSTAMRPEVASYANTVVMSQVEGDRGPGLISGLNGLLLGVARQRGVDAICLMGEVPYYLQAAPWPYPMASISVMEVLGTLLAIEPDTKGLRGLAGRVDRSVDELIQNLQGTEGVPQQILEEIEKLKHTKQAGLGPITREEQSRIMEHIDELFKPHEDGSDRKHV